MRDEQQKIFSSPDSISTASGSERGLTNNQLIEPRSLPLAVLIEDLQTEENSLLGKR